MLYHVLAASGLIFWIAIGVAALVIALPLRNDTPSGAVLLFIVAIVATILFTDIAARVSLWALVLLLPIYILIGVGWALFKWRGFVLERKAEVKAKWGAGPKDKALDVVMALPGSRPTAADNKDKITGWMALWPWSMSWVVLKFPWRVIVWTYERISTVFERASAKLWQE